jgi:hypothetical protein
MTRQSSLVALCVSTRQHYDLLGPEYLFSSAPDSRNVTKNLEHTALRASCFDALATTYFRTAQAKPSGPFPVAMRPVTVNVARLTTATLLSALTAT